MPCFKITKNWLVIRVSSKSTDELGVAEPEGAATLEPVAVAVAGAGAGAFLPKLKNYDFGGGAATAAAPLSSTGVTLALLKGLGHPPF